MSVLPGFVKGQSDNLPKIDAISMFGFLGTNPDFMGAEMRGVKANMSGRESYGDNAVGYVQVSRNLNVCTVKARVTPEHSLRKKAYNVNLICNKLEEKIISVQCEDCAASLGGCKHAIALLAWIHRRSEEPAVKSVACYWKQSKLSTVGKSLKFIKAKNMGKKRVTPLSPNNGLFLKAILDKSKSFEEDTQLTKYCRKNTDVENLSLHILIIEFCRLNNRPTADEFLIYCKSHMLDSICEEVTIKTLKQSGCSLWFELRYGRITASKAHEAAHCRTLDGSLVETILGASHLKDTTAMKRGRNLEKMVRKQVEIQRKIRIRPCGFYVSSECPIMGASPDGISDDYVIEIKCPYSDKAIVSYIRNGEITNKYKGQIQMQMLYAKKPKGLFCVASTDFERSNVISILEVDFDAQYCADIIEKCGQFWKAAIFPMLVKDFS